MTRRRTRSPRATASPSPRCRRGEVVILLHPGLEPRVEGSAATLTALEGGDGGTFASRYRLTLAPGVDAVTVAYGGVIDHPLEQVGEEYARGQRETRGTISDGGVFLSGRLALVPAARSRTGRSPPR